MEENVREYLAPDLGDHKALDDGVWEARVNFGLGIFGQAGSLVVI